MHLEVQDGLVALALILAVATMLAIAPALRIPYPILLVLGGLAIGLVPGDARVRARPGARLLRRPAAAALQRRVLHVAPRPAGERQARSGCSRSGWWLSRRSASRSSRTLSIDGLSWAQRVRARSDRLPDRSARRDLDRASPRRPAQARDDRGGREPRQRRHGARPLPGRGRGGGDADRSRRSTPAGCSSSARAAGSPSGSASVGSCARFAGGSTTLRRRSRSRC